MFKKIDAGSGVVATVDSLLSTHRALAPISFTVTDQNGSWVVDGWTTGR